MNKLRKSLVVGVMVLTVLATSGVFNISAVKASASAGDLIKMSGNAAVYYLDANGKRYVFPNSTTYFSWYPDFSGVITIPATELQSYLLGGNVVMRAGTELVKITTDPSVYAVEPNGVLRKIQSEAQAASLYGINWNRHIVDVPDSYFTNYSIGTALANGSIPAGSLVKNAGAAAVYYYDGTNYRSVASESAMIANRFDFANVLTVTNTLTAGGAAITGMETALVKTSQSGSIAGPVVTGSGLMVSLNSQTPASMNIPGNSPVEFLKINLTAANDGPVNVSSINLTSYGLSAGTYIDDVTFYDNGVKVGNSKSINSDNVALFNFATPIYVAAGTTKTLTVKATISTTGGSYGLGIAKASDIVSSGAAVSGSFPIIGSFMSAVEASIGTITIDSAASSTASASFGEDNVLLADFTLAAGSNENALVQSLSLYNAGTNDNGIVSNLKLFINGEEKATGVYNNRYAAFTLNNYEIVKGDTVNVEVRGDMGITSGTSDTVKFYLKDSGDLVAVGKTHGFNLAVTNSFPSTSLINVSLVAGDFTIAMDKTATPAKDVKADTQNVVLATLSLVSNGENATLSNIAGSGFYVTVANRTTATSTLLENAEMVDLATGGVYDLAIATTSNTTIGLTMSDDISLVKGVVKKFAIRADILSTVPETTTFKVALAGTAMTIEGDVSGAAPTSITPASVSGALITVKAASLTVSPTVLTGVNVVGGASDVSVYQAKVKAGTADGVKIQAVTLTAASSSLAYAFNDTNITKLDLYLNGKLLRSISNQINESAKTVTFNSLDTANNTVAAGAEVTLEVKATFASNLVAGDFTLALAADAVTARSVVGSDAVVVNTAAATPSRVVTAVEKGTLAVTLVTTDAKANRDSFLLAGSQTEANRYLGEIKFTTANEAVKVTTLSLEDVASSTSADLSSVKLVKADGTVVATQAVSANGDVTFDPFDVVFDADQTTSLFIIAVAKGLNVSGDPTATAIYGDTVQYTLTAATAVGNESGEDITVTSPAGTSKTATIVGSKLNTVVNALSNGNLVGGTQVIGKYTLAFDNGSNRTTTNEELKAILATTTVTISKSAGVEVTAVQMYVDGSPANVATSTANGTGTSTTAVEFSAAALASLVDGGKLDGSVTLVITAVVNPSSATGEFVQTSFADLNGAGNNDAIEYFGDGKSQANGGVALTNMFIPVISVTGGTLSE